VSLTAAAGSRPRATRIAVTSGKGGVGKTSLTINLAVAMARLGHRVGILDADFALGNIDVLLGLTPEQHLGAVLDGVLGVGDVTLEGPSGVRIIPAGSGVRALTALDDDRWMRLVSAIEEAGRDLDFLFFDTATGISDNVLELIRLADYALVVTSYDPAAVVDAYAVIKLITASDVTKPIGVVVNSARDPEEGGLVFRQISLAADRFLGRTIRYEGHVLEDRLVKESVFSQTPLMLGVDATGPAVGCIRRVATRLTTARPNGPGGPWPAMPRLVERPAQDSTMETPRCA
jgi:flagellar biosynthesis protein FlhG